MTSSEISILLVIAFVGSFLGGFLCLILQQWFQNRKDYLKKVEQKTISGKNLEKIISDDIFEQLRPGRTVEKMREILGVPNKLLTLDYPIYSENEKQTNSYIYMFQNANVKITSVDNKEIDSITILGYDNSLAIDYEPLSQSNCQLNVATIPIELAESPEHLPIRTRLDQSFAISIPSYPPEYIYLTYFGYGENVHKYYESNNPKFLVGEIIDGFCMSHTSKEVFYIYDFELR
jgi:hypothetical protein